MCWWCFYDYEDKIVDASKEKKLVVNLNARDDDDYDYYSHRYDDNSHHGRKHHGRKHDTGHDDDYYNYYINRCDYAGHDAGHD